MEKITTEKWKGLDNLHQDVELPPDLLRSAVNVDFNETGKARGRLGYSQVSAVAASNGFAFGQHVLFIQGSALQALHTQTGVVTELFPVQGDQIGRVVVGDYAYVSDGVSKWRISNSLTVADWELGDTDTYDPRIFRPFPACTKLAYYQGTLLGVVGGTVIQSAPYAFGIFDPSQDFMSIRGRINVLYANDDTVFLGSKELLAVSNFGSEAVLVNSLLALDSIDMEPVVSTGNGYWLTSRGVVQVPLKGADIKLLSPDRLGVADAVSGAVGVVRRDGITTVIATLVPDTSFAINHPLVAQDYLDADRVRKEIYDAL